LNSKLIHLVLWRSSINAFANQSVNIAQALEQRTHARERQHIRAIRRRSLWRVVNFHEYRINSAGNAGPREWFDVLRQSAGCITETARKL
jgi:hypothetical protein